MEKQIELAVLCEKVDTLEKVVIDEKKRLNGNLERIDRRLAAMSDKLDAAKELAMTASSSKPTWGVSLTITALVSALTGLATWVIRR